MRRRRSLTAPALAGTALLLAWGGTALGASRTITLDGWSARALAFSGDRLVWTEAATVTADPARTPGAPPGSVAFRYYRADTSRIHLDRTSRRFLGPPETPVTVRTSIAPMAPGALAPTGDGGFVMAPTSRSFAPPVVWCCTRDDEEVVIESDGRPDAPVTLAATATPDGVRFLQMTGGGQVTRDGDPASGTATPPGAPGAPTGQGLAAITPRGRAWVDPAARGTLWIQPASAPAATPFALPGPAARVVGAGNTVAVAVRVDRRVWLLRAPVGAPGPLRVVWGGARVPRIAVGGNAVAIADGRRVLAARSGTLRRAAQGRRTIDAVGVDGRRLAWVERGLRHGRRVGVVRLGRTP